MNETDDLFSPRQIAQIKLANSKIRDSLQLDEHDYGLDERNLREAIEKISRKSAQLSTKQKYHVKLTRKLLGLYLGSAFVGGLSLAGSVVALLPTLVIPYILSTRSVVTDNDTLRGTPLYQIPENLETQGTVRLTSNDPQESLIKLTESATRAGLVVFVLGGDSNGTRLNIYGMEQNNLHHSKVWEEMGIPPSNHRSISVEITR